MAVQTPNNAAAKANAAAAIAARDSNNWAFMRTALKQYAVCPPSSGAGTNQSYSSGSTLIFDVPTSNGGYLESLLFQFNLTVTNAAGTGATYALTAGAPYSLVDHIVIQYGNTTHTFRPIVLKHLAQLQGYEKAQPEQVNSGQTVSFVGSTVWGSPFGVASGANTWKFWFRVPMHLIPRSPAGMLPIMGDSTRCQVSVVCASAPLGNDPLLNAVATTAGTGAAVTVSGTVAVEAISQNGVNLVSTRNMGLDLQGLPTIQWTTESQYTPLTSGSMLHKKLDSKLQHLYVISYIIDGQAFGKFAGDANISGIELTMDSTAQNKFYSFGVNGNNVGFTEYRELLRNTLGQDIDEGVIPYVGGPAFGGVDPDGLEGTSYLNCIPGAGGWPDANLGFQVGTVASPLSGITPRVETFCISVNPQGLVRA